MRNTVRGFTLIELLVVIAIIAILAAILFPIFTKAKISAHISACTSNLRQIGSAISLYRDDYNGGYPLYLVAPGGTWPKADQPQLERYTKNRKIFLCPDDYTKGKINFDIGWEYFSSTSPNTSLTSYAYHAGYHQLVQTGNVPAGVKDKWLAWQLNLWKSRFIVAACPWHRHLETRGALASQIKDMGLRADGSIRKFYWPNRNWEYEPYN